jgi:hypothetical protein
LIANGFKSFASACGEIVLPYQSPQGDSSIFASSAIRSAVR